MVEKLDAQKVVSLGELKVGEKAAGLVVKRVALMEWRLAEWMVVKLVVAMVASLD